MTTPTTSPDGQSVRTERQEPSFYARIPKMVTDDLSPYELSLYVHYKQIAADTGSCYMSNKNLAKACGMSVTRLQQARASLERSHLISVTAQDSATGSLPPIVTIRDVWDINHQRYAVSSVDGSSTLQEGVGAENQPGTHQKTGGLTPETNKEEPIQEKEQEITAPQAASVVCSESTDADILHVKDKPKRPPTPHQLRAEALITVFGLDVTETFKSKRRTEFTQAASEIGKLGIDAEQVPDLFKFVKDRAKRERWSSFGPGALSKYAPDYLADRRNKLPTSAASVTQAEYDEWLHSLPVHDPKWSSVAQHVN